jgi:exodeoxyribonuclease III
MKLISWNCQGAFRKKANVILTKTPDILIIQECESLEKLENEKTLVLPDKKLWFGDNKHKGLGIFSKEDLRVHESYNSDIKYIVPVSVTIEKIDCVVFAVWANNKEDNDGQYVEQVWKAINYYEEIIENEKVILTGDFNSNAIWDRPKRRGNHSEVVEKLAASKIQSIYHKHLNQEQGKEFHSTFFLYKNKNKPYHIDYCFASQYFTEKVIFCEVGMYEDWIPYSDHMPIFVEFDFFS